MTFKLGQWVRVSGLSGIDSGKYGYIIKLNAPNTGCGGDYKTSTPSHLVRFTDGERRIPVGRLEVDWTERELIEEHRAAYGNDDIFAGYGEGENK